MFKLRGSIFEKVGALASAFLFAELPLFISSYEHHLQGHLAELQWQVNAIQKMAADSHKSPQELIHKFLASQDADFANYGKILEDLFLRWTQFSEALAALNGASVVAKPFIFLKHLSWDISKETYGSFHLGIPLTYEGLIYGLFGAALGYLAIKMARNSFTRTYDILMRRNVEKKGI